MSQAITAARPYAQAAFDEAQKLGDLKGWSELLVGLAEVVQYPDVSALISNPRIAKDKVAALLVEAMGGKLSSQQVNLIQLLAENGRLAVLPEMAAIYETLKAEAEKSVNVEVESAFELSSAQKDQIVAALKKRMAREINLSCSVNKDLLGGVVIRAGDKVIDGSARSRLGEMASAMA